MREREREMEEESTERKPTSRSCQERLKIILQAKFDAQFATLGTHTVCILRNDQFKLKFSRDNEESMPVKNLFQVAKLHSHTQSKLA